MCFTFSNFSEEVKDKYIKFFENKGVQISTENLCDPETTHVVAQKMGRSEKMLGSIASGKWILHPSYVETCIKADKILPNFADYQWGNPDTHFIDEVAEKEQQLAKAAFR